MKLEHDFESDDDDSEQLKPMVFFLPTGETLPFEITLRDMVNNEQYVITLEYNGIVSMGRNNE